MKNLNSLVKNISVKNIILFIFLILICYLFFFKSKESFNTQDRNVVKINDYGDAAKLDDGILDDNDLENAVHNIKVFENKSKYPNNPYDFGEILDYVNFTNNEDGCDTDDQEKRKDIMFILHKKTGSTYLTKIDHSKSINIKKPLEKNNKWTRALNLYDRDYGIPNLVIDRTTKLTYNLIKINADFNPNVYSIVGVTGDGKVYASLIDKKYLNLKPWIELDKIPNNSINKINSITNIYYGRRRENILINVSINEEPECYMGEVKLYNNKRNIEKTGQWNKCMNLIKNQPYRFKQIVFRYGYNEPASAFAIDKEGKLYFTPYMMNKRKNSIVYMHHAFWRDFNTLLTTTKKQTKNASNKLLTIPSIKSISRFNNKVSKTRYKYSQNYLYLYKRNNYLYISQIFNIDFISKENVAMNLEIHLDYRAQKNQGRIIPRYGLINFYLDKFNPSNQKITNYKNYSINNDSRNKNHSFFAIHNKKLSIIKPSNIIPCSDKKTREKCDKANSKHGINESINGGDVGQLDLRDKKCKFSGEIISEEDSGINNFMDTKLFKNCTGKPKNELCSLRDKLNIIIDNDGIEDGSEVELQPTSGGTNLMFGDVVNNKSEYKGTVSQILENTWNKFIKDGVLPILVRDKLGDKMVYSVGVSAPMKPFGDTVRAKGLILDKDEQGNILPCQNETIVRWAATTYLKHILDNINFSMTSEDSDELSSLITNSFNKIKNTLKSNELTTDAMRAKIDNIYEETNNLKPESATQLRKAFQKERERNDALEEEQNERYYRNQLQINNKIMKEIQKANNGALTMKDLYKASFNTVVPGVEAGLQRVIDCTNKGICPDLEKNAENYVKNEFLKES